MDHKNTQNQTQKYDLPTRFEEWVNYQKPKEFVEKIRTVEDVNIMGKFAFEKAEMTFYYVDQVISIFEGAGL